MNNGVKTFTITSQPYYDQYNECYKNILMVNAEPLGPLTNRYLKFGSSNFKKLLH
jgi:hypothetical protein